jgi:predicted TIM-barrel fold metal-dependent hydrolase
MAARQKKMRHAIAGEFEFPAPIWQKFCMPSSRCVSRRQFLATTGATILASPLRGETPEPVIDIHQHTSYLARSDEDLIAHQRTMGVTQTILLPAGTPVVRPSTHAGKSNGLAARCGGNESVLAVARAHPGEFFFGANEVTDLDNARPAIERYLKLGAKVIGEQKFGVDCDSAASEAIYHLAEEAGVPVLMHFQNGMYNLGIERFHHVLEKFPRVRFVAHAQTFWANIDASYVDQTVLYPKGPIIAGGISDRLLTDYPNFFGDLSAGSGLNALTRDEDFTRGFFDRHQDKLMFGSDCADPVGQGEECTGAQTLAVVRRLAPTKTIERKLLYENARRLFRL